MNNSKKYLFLSIITTILMITILFVGKVDASTYDIKTVEEMKNKGTIGQTMMLGGGDLRDREDVFCFEHKTAFVGGEYTIYDIVEINGKDAKSTGTKKTATTRSNVVMNYLLSEGNYSKAMFSKDNYMTARNIAIWSYQNTWVNALGNGFFKKNWKHDTNRSNISNNFNSQLQSEKEDAKKLLQEAKSFANTNVGKASVVITGNKEVYELAQNIYGPFKVRYTGNNITLTATDLNGNTIPSNKIKVFSDSSCKTQITQDKIKSNSNFYVKIIGGTKIKGLKLKVSSTILSAKIIFLGRSDFWNGHGQGIIFVKPGKEPVEKSVDFIIKRKSNISLSGYVWVDVRGGKENKFDNLWNTSEARVAGVTVKLIKVENNKAKVVGSPVTTDINGAYTFDKKVVKDDLAKYYVEFDYNGVKDLYVNGQKVGSADVSKYITVAYSKEANGSKALMNSVAVENSNLSGIASTYKGIKDDKTYGLSGFEIKNDMISNINLGLKQPIELEFDVTESLQDVKIGIKGFEYTYYYEGGSGNKNNVGAPTVGWQSAKEYTSDIYASDIVYNPEDASQKLKVNVTYKIEVINSTIKEEEELYMEDNLVITSLINQYDTERYHLVEKDGWVKKDGQEGIAQYTGEAVKSIAKGSKAELKITFSVDEAELQRILKDPEGIIERKPTKVIAQGYHNYRRKDYSWENNISAVKPHKTAVYEKDAESRYLRFKLGQERILSGVVFKDGVVTEDGQLLGNGVYNDKENTVKGVTVELMDINPRVTEITGLTTSHLYGIDTNREPLITDAKVVTTENGKYELKGIVPGYYCLRFTYGDGTQKICEINGTEVKELSTLTAKEYKSTIVTNAKVKEALLKIKQEDNFKDTNRYIWYRELSNVNPSIAIDDLTTRVAVNEGNQTNIMAGTAKLLITIENTPDDSTNIELEEVDENGVKHNVQTKLPSNAFGGLNFGIIEQPKQEVQLEKIITNIKLQHPQNPNIINGNPQTDNLKGVVDEDGIDNGGSSKLRIELVESDITGTLLTVTYKIKVTNNSDINYYNDAYYWYGEKVDNKEVTLKIDELIDYLDKELAYNEENSKSKFVVVNKDEQGRDLLKPEETLLLYTAKNDARKNDQKEYAHEFEITTNAKTGLDADAELEFINMVKVLNADNATDTRDEDSNKENEIKKVAKIMAELPEAEAKLSIGTPFGANKQETIMYIVAGVVALITLAAGLVMIKRIVKI